MPVAAGGATFAEEGTKQEHSSFSDTLKPLLPHFVKAHVRTTDEPLMDRARDIGKTSWNVFKQTLKIVKEASAPVPHLQFAISVLLAVLEQYDTSLL